MRFFHTEYEARRTLPQASASADSGLVQLREQPLLSKLRAPSWGRATLRAGLVYDCNQASQETFLFSLAFTLCAGLTSRWRVL